MHLFWQYRTSSNTLWDRTASSQNNKQQPNSSLMELPILVDKDQPSPNQGPAAHLRDSVTTPPKLKGLSPRQQDSLRCCATIAAGTHHNPCPTTPTVWSIDHPIVLTWPDKADAALQWRASPLDSACGGCLSQPPSACKGSYHTRLGQTLTRATTGGAWMVQEVATPPPLTVKMCGVCAQTQTLRGVMNRLSQ